jgi:PTH1 family peptidyl-tRNA hydrolase
MKLIIGLGNPGEKYQNSRHNLGFMAVEQFLKDFESASGAVWQENKKLKSDIVQIEWQRRSTSSGQALLEKVILAKPKTYMNNSGMAVGLISKFYKIATSDIWILNDELDLPIGSMRIRFGGSSAGHNGVGSVIEALSTDKFWRIRLGIGKERLVEKLAKHNYKNAEDYVLGSFSAHEKGKVRQLIKRASKAISMALEEGMEASMNKFNTK